MKFKLFLVLLMLQVAVQSKSQSASAIFVNYHRGLDSLQQLLENPQTNGAFKKAVFLTENVFVNNGMQLEKFEDHIAQLATIVKVWMAANPIKGYPYKDSVNFHKNFGIYKVMKDTVRFVGRDNVVYQLPPYTYDFTDFFGRNDWGHMFVTKLLSARSGNCHSLPYLYKILADELGASCWLALAPNHIYIKNRSQKSGWYNTELTSGSFPIDAWITASGYIPLQAIQNGIYMDTLSNQQAIALCLLDLAKGYEFQTKNYEDGFIVKCCDLLLKYHPINVQAILLKAETLKRNYEAKARKDKQAAKAIYTEMEKCYAQLFELGYREMPESMYLNWLKSLDTEKVKYQNRNL